jgi:ribosome biogenesis GTPase
MQTEGRILRGISSFYAVETDSDIVTCKARGVFRKNGITPLPGDWVTVTPGAPGEEGTIDEVHPRRNELVRPPLANLDQLFVITSVCEPNPNLLVTDHLIAIAEHAKIEPIVVVSKSDLADSDPLCDIYRKAGFQVFCVGKDNHGEVDAIRDLLRGRISAFAGNSGVGKSTLLNAIDPTLLIETAQISRKLGRGRHTTRHVELYRSCGGYVADTPGFSALDIENGAFIHKDELQYCFREFAPFLDGCRFGTSCAHIRDKGCKVLEAVEAGVIPRSRHESYAALYAEAKEIKDWQIR